jgi:hypothetical protein
MSRPRFVNYAIVVRLLTMSIVWLLLLVWFLNAYRLPCNAALGFVAALGITLLFAGTEQAYLRRRALFNECLQAEGRLFHIFYNRLFMTLREIAFAGFLALLLLMGSLAFEPRQWSLLIADILLLSLVIPRLAIAMSNAVREEYRYAMARHWALWLSVVLLWGEAVMMLYLFPPEDYIGMRWQEVVTYGVSTPDVHCAWLASAAEMYRSAQALAMWAAQNASRVMHDRTQSVMVWVGFIVLFGLTFLTALAISRAFIGVMARPWEMWKSFSAPRSGPATPRDADADER